MTFELYAVQDVKANALDMTLGLIPAQNKDMVIRGLKSVIMAGNLPKQMMQFPEDFYLFRVGILETADLLIQEAKERICCLSDLFPTKESA